MSPIVIWYKRDVDDLIRSGREFHSLIVEGKLLEYNYNTLGICSAWLSKIICLKYTFATCKLHRTVCFCPIQYILPAKVVFPCFSKFPIEGRDSVTLTPQDMHVCVVWVCFFTPNFLLNSPLFSTLPFSSMFREPGDEASCGYGEKKRGI